MEEKTFTGEVLKLVEDTIMHCEKTFTEKDEHSVPPELATLILLQEMRKEIKALREQFSSFAKDNLYPTIDNIQVSALSQDGTTSVPLYTLNAADITWTTTHE